MHALIVHPDQPSSFVAAEQPRPTPGAQDLLVRVSAVALNPVDAMVRSRLAGRTIGWDVAGEVVEVGPGVRRFAVGDRVFYAGALAREGASSALHLVDARLAGHTPSALTDVQAAALPLTSLTAWESLHELAHLQPGERVLIINGAGGVGSIAVQLAKRAGAFVVATASRPETRAWVSALGADAVISHREALAPQLSAAPDVILVCHHIEPIFAELAEIIAPRGRIVAIVPPAEPLPVGLLFMKAATLSWESMFARSSFDLEPGRQGAILDTIGRLVDEGVLRTTLREVQPLTPAAVAAAHERMLAGGLIGKLVFEMPR